MQAEHQAALNAAARSALPPMPVAQPPGAVLPGYPHPGVPIPGMYGYPGMVPFPPPSGNFAAAAVAMGGMPMAPQVAIPPPPGYPMMHHPHSHPPQGLAPMPGGVPGLNHAQHQQQMTAPGMQGTGGAGVATSGHTDSGPVMTDAYIESLITIDVVVSKNGETSKTDSTKALAKPIDDNSSAKDDMNIPLVVPKDRDLIPDALFVALGQMKPCQLQQSDRVGCYKTRTLKFLGMSCKHCGGQPGFGRYFPNSVRSLAQTTTSQTILKHIGGKCRFCPPNVRKAVLELQRQQAHKEHLTTGRPRYGSRKIFFQRMWARLHGQSEDGETAIVVNADVTPERAKAEAERAVAVASSKASASLIAPTMTAVPKDPTSGDGSGVKRSLPTEVSNNNTDDEDAAPSIGNDGEDNSNVLNINLSLNGSDNGSHKKRKLGDDNSSSGGDKVACSDDDDSKKIRISPVEV